MRYVAISAAAKPMVFPQFELAQKYAHSLPPGTPVRISDLQAAPGEPATYLLRSGEEKMRMVSRKPRPWDIG
jgi:hypothetical protein